MNRRLAVLKQYSPWERFLLVVLWAYENAIGRRVQYLFELAHLLGDFGDQKFDVQRVGRRNVFTIASDPEIVSYKISLRRGTSDIPVFRQIFWGRAYKAVIDRIRQDRCEGDINFVVDAGANIGCSTLYFKKLFPGATIVAVEPDEGNYQCLLENIRLNELPNIMPLRAALWTDESSLQVDKTGREWAHSVSPLTNGADVVQAVTVDGLMTQYGKPCIDILKIDIEGAERAIFENEERVRSFLPSVRYLAMEVHEQFITRNEVVALLERFGFSYYYSGELVVASNPRFRPRS